MQLIASKDASERGFSYQEALWIEAVLVEIAGTDPYLVYWLINRRVGSDRQGLFQALREYVEERGWTQELLNDATLIWEKTGKWGKYGELGPPPLALQWLWQAGGIGLVL